MIFPSVDELTQQNKYNRYTLVIAVAKCARMVTDEYVEQRTRADRMIANRETEKPLAALIDSEHRDQKAVKIAVNRIVSGRYVMHHVKPDSENE